MLEEAVRTLKGYFVWGVPRGRAELRLMRGHSSPTWRDEPHVVLLRDEVFSVTRAMKVQTPSRIAICTRAEIQQN